MNTTAYSKPLSQAVYPIYLTEEERADPYLVIRELFDFDNLPGIRELLWESFKATVTGSFPHDLNRQERNEIVFLFEKLKKLVEASYIIHTDRQNDDTTDKFSYHRDA